jgi:recombinational DNA repair protein (RecF pathway)
MSYKTYITDALVCGSRTQNTADKSYLLFTREAGMLYAAAKSVREERSKQRFALQEFSRLRVTLIYGKTGWRITGAEPIINVYGIQHSREGRTVVRNVIRLLRRLLRGESPHITLYDDVMAILIAEDEGNASEREEVMTIRILHALGYIAPLPEVTAIISAPSAIEAARMLDPHTSKERKALIEQAFHESHL